MSGIWVDLRAALLGWYVLLKLNKVKRGKRSIAIYDRMCVVKRHCSLIFRARCSLLEALRELSQYCIGYLKSKNMYSAQANGNAFGYSMLRRAQKPQRARDMTVEILLTCGPREDWDGVEFLQTAHRSLIIDPALAGLLIDKRALSEWIRARLLRCQGGRHGRLRSRSRS